VLKRCVSFASSSSSKAPVQSHYPKPRPVCVDNDDVLRSLALSLSLTLSIWLSLSNALSWCAKKKL